QRGHAHTGNALRERSSLHVRTDRRVRVRRALDAQGCREREGDRRIREVLRPDQRVAFDQLTFRYLASPAPLLYLPDASRLLAAQAGAEALEKLFEDVDGAEC